MSSDHLQTEFYCSDCNENFDSASQLLTHFALHASQNKDTVFYEKNGTSRVCGDGDDRDGDDVDDDDVEDDADDCNTDSSPIEHKLNDEFVKKCNVPDLYPIDAALKKQAGSKRRNLESITNELYSQLEHRISHRKGLDSAQESTDPEEFSPLKYCLVTMEECKERQGAASAAEVSALKTPDARKPTRKRYPCTLCSKVFGWSTDLKRHVLTHTGERPFKCQRCDSCFTRNFLLQKHEAKAHALGRCWQPPAQAPGLKPLLARARESRKQSKHNIQRKSHLADGGTF